MKQSKVLNDALSLGKASYGSGSSYQNYLQRKIITGKVGMQSKFMNVESMNSSINMGERKTVGGLA